MIRVICVLSLLVALLLGVVLWEHKRFNSAQESIQALSAARTADSKAVAAQSKLKARVQVQSKKESNAVQEAATQEPDWSHSVVPSSVLDAAGL